MYAFPTSLCSLDSFAVADFHRNLYLLADRIASHKLLPCQQHDHLTKYAAYCNDRSRAGYNSAGSAPAKLCPEIAAQDAAP